MYLKSIEVQGFKSFANKIVFKFKDGITGIVGPNGSGKSNVADAVRWVLGEQSAKQLRGSSMQDVIFSGTENRKPLGFAYVAITLDNSDHKLPISYDEVTVARRVYRSGESEYLLNGTACRLRDISELFFDTGIGKEGYSIIGQGQIDKILSGKPEERRELFDEAAGIVKFKKRKAATQKKLESEHGNLVRINDILAELEKQLGPLERQSEGARVYLKKREELKELDINLFLLEEERTKADLEKLDANYKIAREDLEDTTREYEKMKEVFEENQEKLRAIEEKLEFFRSQMSESTLRKEQLEGQVNVLLAQIKNAKSNEADLEQRIQDIELAVKEREAQKDVYVKEKTSMDQMLLEAAGERDQAKADLEQVLVRLHELDEKIETAKNEIFRILNDKSNVSGKLQRYDTMLEQIQIRKAEVSNRILRLKSEENEQEFEVERLEKQWNEICDSIEQSRAAIALKETEIEELEEKASGIQETFERGQADYHRSVSRYESLRNIAERYDGYGNSIRKVMEKKKEESGIIGVVADIIKVEKDYEIAIETALGGTIQNIVTQDEETAKKMIGYLKTNKFGRATFLPLTAMRNQSPFAKPEVLKEKGVIGLANTLVRVEEKYTELARYLLGRTVVVDSIDCGIALARKYHFTLRIVTKEGESFSPGGSMTGGAFRNNSNLLGRRREMEELEADIAALKEKLETMEKEKEENGQLRMGLQEKLEKEKAHLQELVLAQNTAKHLVNQAQEKKNSTADEFEDIQRERKEIEQQFGEVSGNKTDILAEMEQQEQLRKELETSIEEWTKEYEEVQAAEKSGQDRLSSLELQYQGISQKEDFLAENMGRVQYEIGRDQETIGQLKINIEEAKKGVTDKEKIIDDMKEAIEKAQEGCAHFEEEMSGLNIEKEELSKGQTGYMTSRDQLSERKNLLDKECFKLTSQKEKMEEASEKRISYLWEEYEVTPELAKSLRNETLTNTQEIRQGIAGLKEAIKKLGNVNVNAIEEYKEVSERFEFLDNQRNDLVEAEETLQKIIQELDEGMRAQFSEKFQEIQVEFDKAFRELFGGGKGRLSLMEDEDMLEAGIRIIAQPPGKKLDNMMQLSGGEKALTAIALLFAIQNLKPSPFCLLDEIEAALDESNVERFAKYLNKLTRNTQFIVITHRRGTMAEADCLYGITMQEKGVSALVSVNLIEDQLEQEEKKGK